MGNETKFSGGCLCGTVRYEAQPDLSSAYYCHCRDCQIGSGSAFKVAVPAPSSSFKVLSGETSTYTYPADSGDINERVFCPRCGAFLWWFDPGFSGQVVLSVSSLDNPEAITPIREVWTKSAVSWSRIPEGIDKFRQGRLDPK